MRRMLLLMVAAAAVLTSAAHADFDRGLMRAIGGLTSSGDKPQIGLVMRPITGATMNTTTLPTPELIGVSPSAQTEFSVKDEPRLSVQWRDGEGRIVRDPFRYRMILLSHDRGLGYNSRANWIDIGPDRCMPLQSVWMTIVLQADQDPALAWSCTFFATWREVKAENEAARRLFVPKPTYESYPTEVKQQIQQSNPAVNNANPAVNNVGTAVNAP